MPWVKWLTKRGSKPSTQLIKEHLLERKLTRLSWVKIGWAIVNFCNWYLEGWERVEFINPVGQAKERDTLAMPREMVDELAGWIKEKCWAFTPLKEKCTQVQD